MFSKKYFEKLAPYYKNIIKRNGDFGFMIPKKQDDINKALFFIDMYTQVFFVHSHALTKEYKEIPLQFIYLLINAFMIDYGILYEKWDPSAEIISLSKKVPYVQFFPKLKSVLEKKRKEEEEKSYVLELKSNHEK
jgi:hypothetical protein